MLTHDGRERGDHHEGVLPDEDAHHPVFLEDEGVGPGIQYANVDAEPPDEAVLRTRSLLPVQPRSSVVDDVCHRIEDRVEDCKKQHLSFHSSTPFRSVEGS